MHTPKPIELVCLFEVLFLIVGKKNLIHCFKKSVTATRLGVFVLVFTHV